LQFAQSRFDFGNERRQFLARFDRRIASQVAGLEELMEQRQRRRRHASGPQLFVHHRFGDRGGWRIQAFANLFLQEPEKCGEEFIGIVRRRQLAQLRDLFPDVPFMALTATATGRVTSWPPRRAGVIIGPQQPGAVLATM